jgi:hypothetical protein
MESKLIESINKQVYKKFPEVQGVTPTLTPRPGDQVLLIYKAAVLTADGHTLDRAIRVVADAAGKIIKMTTSK